ncbi:MAG: PSP1 domain-containing protein [Candidatus Polarisedimenticolia bacterium]
MGCGSGGCPAGLGGCGSSGDGSTSGSPCGAGGCGTGAEGPPREVVGIKFNNTARTHYHDSAGLDLRKGDAVIVETEHGEEFARVVLPTGPSRRFAGVSSLKRVLRQATGEDVSRNDENVRREAEAFEFCAARVRTRRLEMKLVYAEESFDRRKLTFYFTAEGRVDFRELVKELAQQFHSRIEMRQIGPRDEAKALGGYGICGRPLCCTTFLKEFSPVSIRMAKRQGLSLNPSKISGRCGRLMCCLKYEDRGDDGAPAREGEAAQPSA